MSDVKNLDTFLEGLNEAIVPFETSRKEVHKGHLDARRGQKSATAKRIAARQKRLESPEYQKQLKSVGQAELHTMSPIQKAAVEKKIEKLDKTEPEQAFTVEYFPVRYGGLGGRQPLRDRTDSSVWGEDEDDSYDMNPLSTAELRDLGAEWDDGEEEESQANGLSPDELWSQDPAAVCFIYMPETMELFYSDGPTELDDIYNISILAQHRDNNRSVMHGELLNTIKFLSQEGEMFRKNPGWYGRRFDPADDFIRDIDNALILGRYSPELEYASIWNKLSDKDAVLICKKLQRKNPKVLRVQKVFLPEVEIHSRSGLRFN